MHAAERRFYPGDVASRVLTPCSDDNRFHAIKTFAARPVEAVSMQAMLAQKRLTRIRDENLRKRTRRTSDHVEGTTDQAGRDAEAHTHYASPVERMYFEWNEALSRNDAKALLELYAPDGVIESPLIPHLMGKRDGVCRGRESRGNNAGDGGDYAPTFRGSRPAPQRLAGRNFGHQR